MIAMPADAPVYDARSIKRKRRTKVEMGSLHDGLVAILNEDHPQTARGVAYRASAATLIEKTAADFKAVGRALVKLRRAKVIPFRWISDNTRWVLKPTSFHSVEDALTYWADAYRLAVWAEEPVRVEVWVEKDAIASLVYEETSRYDVPVMVCRGYPSHTLLHSTAEQIVADGKPTTIYYFGDHDPSGLDIQRFIEKELTGYVHDLTNGGPSNVRLTFVRAAVTPGQIRELALPTRPTKKTDSRSKGFVGASVDVDAIPARTLRALVRECIERHIRPEQLSALALAEKSERDLIRMFAAEAAEPGGAG